MVAHSFIIIVLFLILPAICLGRNRTNEFDIRDNIRNHKIAKYIAIVLFTILLLYSTSSNVLMAIVLFCENSSYSRAFVLIALQLIISDFMALLPQPIVILPEMLQTPSSSYMNQTTWINYKFTSLFSLSYISALHFSFLLTLNRFVAFILPKYNVFFKSKRLYFLIAFVWLSVFAISIVDFCFCARRFLIWNLTYDKKCGESNDGKSIWRSTRFYWTMLIPNIMFVMYVVIFYGIRRKQRFAANINQNQGIGSTNAEKIVVNRYEWPILIQAAWNCSALEIRAIIFRLMVPFLIKIFGEEIVIPLGIFANSYVILFCAVLPTVHFIYSKEARNIIKHLLFMSFLVRLKNRITINNVKTVVEQL